MTTSELRIRFLLYSTAQRYKDDVKQLENARVCVGCVCDDSVSDHNDGCHFYNSIQTITIANTSSATRPTLTLCVTALAAVATTGEIDCGAVTDDAVITVRSVPANADVVVAVRTSVVVDDTVDCSGDIEFVSVAVALDVVVANELTLAARPTVVVVVAAVGVSVRVGGSGVGGAGVGGGAVGVHSGNGTKHRHLPPFCMQLGECAISCHITVRYNSTSIITSTRDRTTLDTPTSQRAMHLQSHRM